jgi:hypothetical protein
MASTASSELEIRVLAVGPAFELDWLLPDGIRSQVDCAETPAQAIVSLAGRRFDIVLINHTAEGEVTDQQLAYMRAAQAVGSGTKFILLVSHSTTRRDAPPGAPRTR